MSIDAVLVGLASAAIFCLFSAVCVFVIEKLGWPKRRAIAAFLIVAAVVLFLVPPPLMLLTQAGYLEISNPGHAGYRFMGPYFLGSLVTVVFCVSHLRRKQATG
jgi:hypothetical protein